MTIRTELVSEVYRMDVVTMLDAMVKLASDDGNRQFAILVATLGVAAHMGTASRKETLRMVKAAFDSPEIQRVAHEVTMMNDGTWSPHVTTQ